MADAFPGVGHRYRVDFGAFKTELHFISETKMTYAGMGRTAIPGRRFR